MKATAKAPSNIAFIKYWGKKDESLKLPLNGSVSMNLSGMNTITTVEFSKDFAFDRVIVEGEESLETKKKVFDHLDRIRNIACVDLKAKVMSKNNFPVSTGLSSSASAFAALTVSSISALGLNLPEKNISIIARQGSGSASRSIPDGFVEWYEGSDSDSSFSHSIFPRDYFAIVDLVAVISTGKKEVSSTKGQMFVNSSPFLKERLKNISNKIAEIKKYIKDKNFTKFGELVESEALEMHAVMMTSDPSLLYWQPETVSIMKLIKEIRNKGIEAYFTLNTGQDVHVICQRRDAIELENIIKNHKGVREVIYNYPSRGTRLLEEHLF
jgi:diphosphomevalonate decarboxylase